MSSEVKQFFVIWKPIDPFYSMKYDLYSSSNKNAKLEIKQMA